MEYSERVLCGTGEVELDPNIVSEEAGKLYSELQVNRITFHLYVIIVFFGMGLFCRFCCTYYIWFVTLLLCVITDSY